MKFNKVTAFLITLFFGVFAIAGFVGYNGTSNLGVFNKIQCSGATCSQVGDKFKVNFGSITGNVVGSGAVSLSGMLQKTVTASATTITASQCGSTFINAGAVQMELPEASTVIGCRLHFVTANASNFDINPDTGDQILVQTNSNGDAIRNATLGNSIIIQAINSSQWAPVSVQGTWSDIN